MDILNTLMMIVGYTTFISCIILLLADFISGFHARHTKRIREEVKHQPYGPYGPSYCDEETAKAHDETKPYIDRPYIEAIIDRRLSPLKAKVESLARNGWEDYTYRGTVEDRLDEMEADLSHIEDLVSEMKDKFDNEYDPKLAEIMGKFYCGLPDEDETENDHN